MVENPVLKYKGAEWWHSDDSYSPNLSKTSLGDFVYNSLKLGIQIGEIWSFNPNFHRSLVKVSIFATNEQRIALESVTKFKFVKPPKIHVN